MELLTRAPGYLLKVGEELIDVTRFGSLVRRGRTLMAERAPERAAAAFRQALDLRRGEVLVDLVEAGISWPERDAVENACLDAFEDYAEAELMCGRHEEVLVELQRLTFATGQRERLLGLCMMALVRCGRQAEALEMYERRSAVLEQTFGVEPGPELQRLHHAIRTRDPVLLLPSAGSGWCRIGGPATAPQHTPHRTVRDPGQPRRLPGPGAPAPGPADWVSTERRQVSLLRVRVLWRWRDLDTLPESVEERQTQMHTAVQEEAGRFGGTVLSRTGTDWLVAFGVDSCRGDDVYRAVLCALALRARFTHGDHDAGMADDYPAAGGGVLAVVASGLALVRTRADGGPPAVSGTAGERCAFLLPYVQRNEIWVCDRTRQATEAKVVYQRAQIQSVVWNAIGVQPYGHDLAVPYLTVGRDRERTQLNAELGRFLGGTGSHLVTVAGGPGTGKTHLTAQLLRTVRQRSAHEPSPPVVRLPAVLDDWSLAHALRDCCGITAGDPQDAARAKLGRTVAGTARTPDEADRTGAALLPLLERLPGRDRSGGAHADRPQALMTLLESVAQSRRLVLVIDDVEFADPLVLDFVDRLAQPSGGASVFVIADARYEARETRPSWFGNRRYGTTVTVPPLPDRHLDLLWGQLLGHAGLVPRSMQENAALDDLLAGVRRVVVPVCAGVPLIAHDYVRLIRDAFGPGGEAMADDTHAERLVRAVPPTLRWRSEAALDRLPGALRVTLQDAATVGTAVWAEAVAAAGGRDPEEVRTDLDELVHRGFLSVPDGDTPCRHPHYVFRDAVDRHVAYARIPLQACAEKSANYALWTGGHTPGQRAEFLRHHAWEKGLPLPEPGDTAAPRQTDAPADLPRWYPHELHPLVEGLRALLSDDQETKTACPLQHDAPCPVSP
ncbi:BTAD domain-containing putative transcriptional regulator [Streptomyces sp. 4F14]|uniref:BTAD domain-containing putative transcriptional regulator n=1 Tax=Streptomyces sp. 4F14 TaxID=3394380 RepID=UPI003A8C3A8C